MLHEDVKLWVETAPKPFTIDDICKDLKCSKNTVYRALSRHFPKSGELKYILRRKSGRHFFRLYFPLWFDYHNVTDWMNEHNTTRRLRGTIYSQGNQIPF